MSWMPRLSPDAVMLEGTDKVAFQWICRGEHLDGEHSIGCLWVWHDCGQVLGSNSVAPGDAFGWRPSGVRAHTLVEGDPLTITASVYWPDCCGLHGFITDGSWVTA